jgi:hypothetical protein
VPEVETWLTPTTGRQHCGTTPGLTWRLCAQAYCGRSRNISMISAPVAMPTWTRVLTWVYHRAALRCPGHGDAPDA